MFDTNEKINKILGNGNGQGVGNPRQGLGFGRGFGPGPGSRLNNAINVSPDKLSFAIKNVLDSMPEVTSATGTLTLKLNNGTIKKIQVSYADM